MNREYLDRILANGNEWFYDLENTYQICISDDMDSLISYLICKQFRPNWKLNFFYDFREGLFAKDTSINITDDNVICLDLSCPIQGMKSVGNHVTKITKDCKINKSEINMNYVLDDITSNNYFDKYNLSSTLLVYSLLGLKPKSKKESALLLLPDSSFLGYYSKYENDNNANRKWLVDVLQLQEVYEIQKELTREKFEAGQRALNIKSKLWVTENGIESMQNVDINGICDILDINYDPSILEGFFSLIERHSTFTGATWQKYKKEDYFSFVVTRKNQVKYSKKV